MKTIARVSTVLLVLFAASMMTLGAACHSTAVGLHNTSGASHRGTGVIVALDPPKGRVKIQHEKIEGYMDAMTMWFEVRDPKLLDGLALNDRVEFVVTEEASADVVTDIKKL
jgi:Cu/Ag efflux protein CusF